MRTLLSALTRRACVRSLDLPYPGNLPAMDQDALELLCALVRAPSPSGEEGPAADVLERWLSERGLDPVRDGRNVWAGVGEDGPVLLLCSHLDTVPVGEGWTRPPLEAHREGERIYGRGANDAKASVAAMACTLRALRDEGALDAGGRVVLAATCEEETGRPGGLPDLLPRLPPPAAAVVGEPTGLAPVVAQKGLLVLEATAHGRPSHAARPEEGENAIANAAAAIRALAELRFERVHGSLGTPTAVVTVIEGGSRRNTIPARCTFWIDVRTTPAYEPRELAELIGRALGPRVEVRVHSDRIRAVDVDPEDPIVRAAVRATGGAATRGSPTVSDWAFLRGIPAVKLGPGESRRSHAPDEFVAEGELLAAVRVYRELAREWFASRRG